MATRRRVAKRERVEIILGLFWVCLEFGCLVFDFGLSNLWNCGYDVCWSEKYLRVGKGSRLQDRRSWNSFVAQRFVYGCVRGDSTRVPLSRNRAKGLERSTSRRDVTHQRNKTSWPLMTAWRHLGLSCSTWNLLKCLSLYRWIPKCQWVDGFGINSTREKFAVDRQRYQVRRFLQVTAKDTMSHLHAFSNLWNSVKTSFTFSQHSRVSTVDGYSISTNYWINLQLTPACKHRRNEVSLCVLKGAN